MAMVTFNLRTTSLAELTRNMKDTKNDRNVVRNAIRYNVTTYSGGLGVEERIAANVAIAKAIGVERKRRRDAKKE